MHQLTRTIVIGTLLIVGVGCSKQNESAKAQTTSTTANAQAADVRSVFG